MQKKGHATEADGDFETVTLMQTGIMQFPTQYGEAIGSVTSRIALKYFPRMIGEMKWRGVHIATHDSAVGIADAGQSDAPQGELSE